MKGALFCLLLLVAPAAHAVIITQTKTVTAAHTVPGVGSFGGQFQQFSPALGSLDAVNLSIDGSINYTASFINYPSCQLQPYCYATLLLSTVYQLYAPGFLDNAFPYGYHYFQYADLYVDVSYNPTTGLYDWNTSSANPFTTSSLPAQVSDTVLIGYSGSPDSLAGYIGNGSVNINGAWEGDWSDNYFGIYSNYWDSPQTLTTTLSYTYTPVPEPPVLLIFGTGLLALGWLRSRRGRI
ncbi:MAG: PEP-CTERM sorting domain-containing protein [Acidihalobacter sp.]